MKSIYSLLLFVLIMTFSCKNSSSVSQPASTAVTEEIKIQDISVEEAAEKISEGKAIFLDVRTEKEVENGMIPGSIHIDLNSPDFESEIKKLDREKEYVVYCRSGGRSSRACKVMKELGFKNLNNMLGGFNKWN